MKGNITVMDENLRRYLDHRFGSLEKRLDEIEAKLDMHGDRILSCEKDISYLSHYVHDDKSETRDRKAECAELMDAKDKASATRQRAWALAGIVSALTALATTIGGALVKMIVN